MKLLRTPDEAFADLPGYPFAPHYHTLASGARLHYLDEGPRDARETVVALHGEPTWSYLYRDFAPVLAGPHRFLAPDLLGFGRSDKPRRRRDHSYRLHFDALREWLAALEVTDATLIVQDWGGLLGLGILGAEPERFRRVVILNTYLPVGKPLPLAFRAWRAFAKTHPSLPVGAIVRRACARPLRPGVKAAYDAPFPHRRYKAGPSALPLLVPADPADGGVAEMRRAREVLGAWDKPALVLFSDSDPIIGWAATFFHRLLPGLPDEPADAHPIKRAGHFLQEDAGEEIARRVLAWMAETA